MNIKIKKVYCWETGEKCNPTGQERTLLAETKRWAIKHLAYELGGKVSSNRQAIYMPDGKKWFCNIPT